MCTVYVAVQSPSIVQIYDRANHILHVNAFDSTVTNAHYEIYRGMRIRTLPVIAAKPFNA